MRQLTQTLASCNWQPLAIAEFVLERNWHCYGLRVRHAIGDNTHVRCGGLGPALSGMRRRARRSVPHFYHFENDRSLTDSFRDGRLRMRMEATLPIHLHLNLLFALKIHTQITAGRAASFALVSFRGEFIKERGGQLRRGDAI